MGSIYIYEGNGFVRYLHTMLSYWFDNELNSDMVLFKHFFLFFSRSNGYTSTLSSSIEPRNPLFELSFPSCDQ